MKYANVMTDIPGPLSKSLLEEWGSFEAKKVGYQAQIAVDHGLGAMLYDVDGNAFIDWTSGVLVTNLGHSHPELTSELNRVTAQVLNVYEFCTPYRVKAAKDLVGISPEQLDRCFFLSTGSEATDLAVRLMRKVTGKFEILSFFGGFHGRTISTASFGGLPKIKKGLGPSLPGIIRAPYPYCYRCPFQQKPDKCAFLCLEFMDDVVKANSSDSMAGLIVEPYQGSAGFIFPPKGYLPLLEKWARDENILFTLDEVQSSFGRTGKMWASEHEKLKPDLVSVGKGIGNGAVISSLLFNSAKVETSLSIGDLGSTYGGNPVSCVAVSTVIRIFKQEKILENVQRIERIIASRLPRLLEISDYVGDIRGMGMVWGIELVKNKVTKEPAPQLLRKLIDACCRKGLLIGGVGIHGNVVRVAPPLVITEDQMNESIEILESCLKDMKV